MKAAAERAVRLKPVREQVIVITGASSGIGLATARLAARRGARVVAAARSERALRQLAAEIRAQGGEALAVVADVRSEQDVQRIADEATRAFGGFDTWVNNAAMSAYGACVDVTTADLRAIMETNFWGVVYGSRVACVHLATTGGALINVGSVVSDRAVPMQGMYSASKHAVKGWTDALRVELRNAGAPISVTLVKPAPIGTAYDDHAKSYFADQPTHVGPVYSARSVASAILYAAEHRVRDITVGASGHLLSLSSMFPTLTDRLMAAILIPALHSDRLASGPSALEGPTEDLRERGAYPGIVRPSVYTAAVTHPRTTALTMLACAGAAILFARRRTSQTASAAGTSSRNTDRNTVLAHQ
jgi:short-subunit dehydrogenase